MRESGSKELLELKRSLGEMYSEEGLSEIEKEGYVSCDRAQNRIELTPQGEEKARTIIRAHRLAERLVCDVLQEDFEVGACEFEHTLNPELIDSICTLLGHPRECPHGKPIPEGECCKRTDRTAQTSVVPLTELEVGQSARIAYVQCKNDQQMHRIDGLQIRPGAEVKLHQKYPAFVVECEGMSIALDPEIAENIRVWSRGVSYGPPFAPEERGFFRGFGGRRRRRRGR